MAEFASLPFFTDAWVADTSHLTRLERGLYMDLIVLLWRSPGCKVPNEIEWIARRLRCSNDEIELLRRIVSEFLTTTGNWLFQKRLLKEFEYTRAKRQKQSDAAKARHNKDKKSSVASPENETRQAFGSAPSPSPSPSPSHDLFCPKPENGFADQTIPPVNGSTSDALKKPRKRNPYPEDFETFWTLYPTDSGMSKLEAAQIWAKLDTADREKAVSAIPEFKKWVSKQGTDYRVVHAVRYLSKRRFDGFTAAKPKDAALDWSKWTNEQYENAIFAAKRKGRWPETYGPPDRIPKHLIDDELSSIIERTAA